MTVEMNRTDCLINGTEKPLECSDKVCPLRIPCLYGGQPATLSEMLSGADHAATKKKITEFDYSDMKLRVLAST